MLLNTVRHELSRVVDLEPMSEYTLALTKFFKSQGLHMTAVNSPGSSHNSKAVMTTLTE